MPAIFGGEIPVQNVGVIEIPNARAHGGEQYKRRDGRKARRTAERQTRPRGQRIVSASSRIRDRDDSEERKDRDPIRHGPEQGGNKMSVAVHIRVSVRRGRPWKIQRVLPTKAEQNLLKDEYADHNSMAQEFVGNHRLNEKREENQADNL